MILKELGGFGSWIRTHFIISPSACNVKVTSLTWPQVTDIQILRFINYTYWYCNEYLKRGYRSVKNSISDVVANFSEVGSTTHSGDLTWPDPAFFCWNVRNNLHCIIFINIHWIVGFLVIDKRDRTCFIGFRFPFCFCVNEHCFGLKYASFCL